MNTSDVHELINAVHAAGSDLRADPPDLILSRPERISTELKTRLKDHKPELLEILRLDASLRRLEAARISVAIEDEAIRIFQQSSKCDRDIFGVIYSAADMYFYVQLAPDERRLLHSFKRRFGGTTEWKQH